MKILFNNPNVPKTFQKRIDVLKKNNNFSINGFYTKRVENWIVKKFKCKKTILLNSCTSGLEICALLLNLRKTDEICLDVSRL